MFASLAADGPDLETHLGPARDSIDEVVDCAPAGAIDLSGGVHKYMFRGNWKLQIENIVDMYHVPFSHESTISRSGRQFGRRPGEAASSAISDRGSAAARWEERVAWGSPSTGHSYAGHQPIAENLPDDPTFRAYLAALEARHGAARAREILQPKRHNTAFYPNMALQALNQHVRVIVPVAVDRTEVHVYPVQLKGAPDAMNRGFIRHLNITHSAASLIQTDDLENFRRCQAGVAAEGCGMGVVRAGRRNRCRGQSRRLRELRHGGAAAARAIRRLAPAHGRGGMTAMAEAAAAFADRGRIEDFLIREVRLLDERHFEEWRDLFDEDGYYWVPLRPDQSDPASEASLFYDDRQMMRTRFERLRHPRIHAQTPPHRTFT